MHNEKEKYIFTCNLKSRKLALYELGKYDESFHFIRWMDEEIGLFETALNNEELCKRVREKPVIFVRHLFHIDGIDSQEDCADTIVSECRRRMEAGTSFTVQTRYARFEDGSEDSEVEQCSEKNRSCMGRADAEPNPMTTALADRLTSEGYRLDVAEGESIISLFLEEGTVYWGIGNARLNLSHWKGGMPHYSPTVEFGFVSRAEYKLLEVLECFDIDLHGINKAADLGAAPGGWTKVLTEKGVECTSIDPSYLKPEIARNSKVKYCHMTVEEYLRSEEDEQFGIVVNDMKMDMAKSVNIVNAFYDRILEGGIVIMTFKLPHEYSYSDIIRTIQQFNGYVLIGARQLFHNRYEITVVVRREEQQKEQQRKEQRERVNHRGSRTSQLKNKRTISKKLERKVQRKRQMKGVGTASGETESDKDSGS